MHPLKNQFEELAVPFAMNIGEYWRIVAVLQKVSLKKKDRVHAVACLKNDVANPFVDAASQAVIHTQALTAKYPKRVFQFLPVAQAELDANTSQEQAFLEVARIPEIDQGEYWRMVDVVRSLSQEDREWFFEKLLFDVVHIKNPIENSVFYAQTVASRVDNILDFTQKYEPELAQRSLDEMSMFGDVGKYADVSVWNRVV